MNTQIFNQSKISFSQIVGENNVLVHKEAKEKYGGDWTKEHTRNPSFILLPQNSEQIAEILRYCQKNHIPVVPSGGRTGLAAACVANQEEVVISLEKLNKILSVDPVGLSIQTEAGVITQRLQETAKEHNLFFPIDLAAKGSCQIGGNIATNAGGLKFIRFGGTREQVLGLEVVLANGDILDLDTSVRKNNTGYDLKQLFIGSEGTLGIITKATLKLIPQPHGTYLACIGLDSTENILKLLEFCFQEKHCIAAFEYFSSRSLELVLKHSSHLKTPFGKEYPYYVLLEIEGFKNQSQDFFYDFLEKLFGANIILDATLAESSQQTQEFWQLRENISESLYSEGHLLKNDISIPITSLVEFEAKLNTLLESINKAVKIYIFGHIGDGNLHLNYLASKDLPKNIFKTEVQSLEKKVYALVHELKGSVSAEHGIGLLKKEALHFSRSSQELNFMRQIKKCFDPTNILNPGKIF